MPSKICIVIECNELKYGTGTEHSLRTLVTCRFGPSHLGPSMPTALTTIIIMDRALQVGWSWSGAKGASPSYLCCPNWMGRNAGPKWDGPKWERWWAQMGWAESGGYRELHRLLSRGSEWLLWELDHLWWFLSSKAMLGFVKKHRDPGDNLNSWTHTNVVWMTIALAYAW